MVGWLTTISAGFGCSSRRAHKWPLRHWEDTPKAAGNSLLERLECGRAGLHPMLSCMWIIQTQATPETGPAAMSSGMWCHAESACGFGWAVYSVQKRLLLPAHGYLRFHQVPNLCARDKLCVSVADDLMHPSKILVHDRGECWFDVMRQLAELLDIQPSKITSHRLLSDSLTQLYPVFLLSSALLFEKFHFNG